MNNKNDDFYDNYDDKSGKGVLTVGGSILGLLFLIISFVTLIDEGNPFPLIITICYISIIVGYIYYQKKNSKLSDDFVPSNKTKEMREKEYEQRLEQARIYQVNAQAQEWLNKPKCPTCGSTNIKKIGSIERGASIAAFGIFSKKINKTFKCSNCGYTW